MKLHVALLTLAGVLMAGAVVAVAVESGTKKPAVIVRDLPGGRHETCKQMPDGGVEECHPVEAPPAK
jgi:uncharacterized membrane protein